MAPRIVRTTCTDTTEPYPDDPDRTVCIDGSVHEPVHAFHGDYQIATTERYRRQRNSMLINQEVGRLTRCPALVVGISEPDGGRTSVIGTVLCLVAGVCYAAG